jgi:oligopeptidase B
MMRSKGFARLFVALLALVVAGLLPVSCSHTPPQPPVAKTIAHTDTVLGHVRVDQYYWLRQRGDTAVTNYLKAENKYTDEVMKHTEKFQDKLYKEMLGRIKETDLSVPVKEDSFYYYSRSVEGKQYPIMCRKLKSLDAPEEILLDVNVQAEGHDFFDLGAFSVSPNHTLLAYSIDTAGNEDYTLVVKNLATGEMYSDSIPNTSAPIEWTSDNGAFIYPVLDDIHRPYKLYLHKLGTTPDKDSVIFNEKDKAFSVYISKSKDKKYFFIGLSSNNATEYYFAKADNPLGKFTLFQARQPKVEYYVYHQGNDFYIHTNENAPNFRILKTPDTKPGKQNWKEVIPGRDSVYVEGIDVFKDFLTVFERENGLREIRVINLGDNSSYYVDFPEPIYIFWPSGNIDYDTDSLRFSYMSLVTPQTVYDYNLRTKERTLLKQYEVLGGYNPDEYLSERIFATADDGMKIPISLVYKKSLFKKDGSNPCYLRGYGSYGSSMEPTFYSNRLSLLDRGFVVAIAHVRGGSEMGRWWYEEGRLLNKRNTFTDFIACAQYLVDQKYTSPSGLVANGGSAGGLLMGAIANMRPDLFRIIVADVPFVDIVNTMLDPSIPLTVEEYTEWGNPHEEEYYNYMMSYSPYDNVKPQNYPNMLITAGLNDPRVQYWEPAKWTAKLRANNTDNNIIILKTNMEAGHMGASGRYDYLKDVAFEYAFIFDILGIKK